jgi:hypothetical protein
MEKLVEKPLSPWCCDTWLDLFHGEGYSPRTYLRNITVAEAAKALRAKLTTGKADWS